MPDDKSKRGGTGGGEWEADTPIETPGTSFRPTVYEGGRPPPANEKPATSVSARAAFREINSLRNELRAHSAADVAALGEVAGELRETREIVIKVGAVVEALKDSVDSDREHARALLVAEITARQTAREIETGPTHKVTALKMDNSAKIKLGIISGIFGVISALGAAWIAGAFK